MHLICFLFSLPLHENRGLVGINVLAYFRYMYRAQDFAKLKKYYAFDLTLSSTIECQAYKYANLMKRVVHDCSLTQTNRLHTVIYRQTARQIDIQQDIQTDGSTERHTARYTDRRLDR